jgi:hypothetical protein
VEKDGIDEAGSHATQIIHLRYIVQKPVNTKNGTKPEENSPLQAAAAINIAVETLEDPRGLQNATPLTLSYEGSRPPHLLTGVSLCVIEWTC